MIFSTSTTARHTARLTSVIFFLVCASFTLSCSDSESESTGPDVDRQTAELQSEGLIDGRALFRQHCSGCHGILGDGKGETVLKKPARSFAAGGFAFGNTPEALFKTISMGMPGQSEMPSFTQEMNAAERHAVVAHVRTLIPKEQQTDDGSTILRVSDRPLVFRGILSSLANGSPMRPRGLLIGFPDGTTFEYRIDDVRLLAVRKGGFVKRTDWVDRGGTPAIPLGEVVYLVGEGNPGPLFYHETENSIAPMAAHMRGSFAFPDMAGVSYRLEKDDHSETTINIKESPSVQQLTDAMAFERRFLIEPTRESIIVRFDEGTPNHEFHGRDQSLSDKHPQFPSIPLAPLKPVVRKNTDGSALILVYRGSHEIRMGVRDNGIEFKIPPSESAQDLQIMFISKKGFTFESLETLAKEVIW